MAGLSKGTLVAGGALVFVVVVMLLFPPARLFTAISLVVGLVVAIILHFVNRRPVKLKDEDNKRPLGLD